MGYLKNWDDVDTYFEQLPEKKYDEVDRLIRLYMRVKKKRTKNKIYNRIDSFVKVVND